MHLSGWLPGHGRHSGIFAGVLVLFIVLGMLSSCRRSTEPNPREKIWTMNELKGLQGKSRDEIREMLGFPNGLYTYDSKGRWHYSGVLVSVEGEVKPKPMTVMVYFSQFGENRSTIIEVTE